MDIEPQVVGTIQAIVGVLVVLLLKPALDNRNRTGSTSFALLILGISLWTVASAVGSFFWSYTVSLGAYYLLITGAQLAAVGWSLLGFTLTGRPITRRFVLLLATGVICLQLLMWTNSAHGQFIGAETAMSGPTLIPDHGVGFWLHSTFAYVLVLTGAGLLGVEALRSRGLRRKQMALLMLAVFPGLIANIINLAQIVSPRYDITPFGFTLSAVIFAIALYSGRFLDISPVARRTAVSQMADAMVTVDDQERVVDCNESARSLVDVESDWEGMPAEKFFAPFGDQYEQLYEQFQGSGTVETEIELTTDGEKRYFDLSISPVAGPQGKQRGTLIVLLDVTLLKRREKKLREHEAQLNLLRQIQSRVLRHNIRNDLGIVRLYNEQFARELDGRHAEMAEKVVSTTDDLVAISDKVRVVEQLVEKDQTPTTVDLVTTVETISRSIREEFPAVTVTTDLPEAYPVEAIPAVRVAIENLIENAAEHNDAAEPVIEVTLVESGGSAVITITDNGPGIYEDELTVLEKGEETPLKHGSGVGLWVVNWVCKHSETTVEFDTDDHGTTVTVRVPRSREVHTE